MFPARKQQVLFDFAHGSFYHLVDDHLWTPSWLGLKLLPELIVPNPNKEVHNYIFVVVFEATSDRRPISGDDMDCGKTPERGSEW